MWVLNSEANRVTEKLVEQNQTHTHTHTLEQNSHTDHSLDMRLMSLQRNWERLALGS